MKVGLGDLFYPQSGDYGQNTAYRNRIDRKHVDFLLCDPLTVRPILGIELDDKSHQREDRKERDIFVNGVFNAVGLPLARVSVRSSYPTDKLKNLLLQKAGVEVKIILEPVPQATLVDKTSVSIVVCPQCGSEMVLRTARSGQNQGNKFWGCSTYPKCKGIIAYED
jgi:predicted RNA-binding Zn-ribbon protein involved in translation (DUF1610 family)